jgi:hypothetical protein
MKATMSWDAVLFRIKGKLRPIEEMDDDDYLPLGLHKEVVSAILASFPTATRKKPTQLIYTEGDLSIEFIPQGRNPVESVLLEVRGEGDPISPLLDLATRNGWVMLDASTSEFIDADNPSDEGYGGYRKLLKSARAPKQSKRPKPPKK